MAKKKGGSKSGTKSGKNTPNTTELKFAISVLNGNVQFDMTKGNGYSIRGGKKLKWAVTQGLEFKLDFTLIPYAGLDGSKVWPFDDPPAVDGNSTDWVTKFTGYPGDPGVYKYDVLVRVKGTEDPIAHVDPVIIVGRG